MKIALFAPFIALLFLTLAACGSQSNSVDTQPDLATDSSSPMAVEVIAGVGLQTGEASISLGQSLEVSTGIYGEPDKVLVLTSDLSVAHYGARGVSVLLGTDSKVDAIYLYPPFSGTGPDGIAIGTARATVEEGLGKGEENPFDGTVYYPAGLSVAYADNEVTAIHIVQSAGN